MKTVVRIPGPSCVEKRMMLKIFPPIELPPDFVLKTPGFRTLPVSIGVINLNFENRADGLTF
ncbi:MAG: hypothetical protein MUC57_09600 [Desulfobacterales bacterium]|nr:hypothetical protein [Desulfobacterales bacterium]